MTDETTQAVVAKATERAFDDWACEHPSLAAVIDRIRLTRRAGETLSNSQGYRNALAAFQASRDEQAFLTRLIELGGPIVRTIIGI